MTKKSGFAGEFAKQRAKLGSGKTFIYEGKSYSTNRADDKPGMTSSPRPKANPGVAKPALTAGGTSKSGGPRYGTSAATPPATPAMTSSPRPKPRPEAAPATTTMTSSPRPKARPNEILGATGGQRKPNADGKYSPTLEMQFRNAAKKSSAQKTSTSAGGDMPRVDSMGNAYKKGGMVSKSLGKGLPTFMKGKK